MKLKENINLIILILSTLLGFIFPKILFKKYALEMSALLLIFFYLTKHYLVAKFTKLKIIESSLVILIILTIVNSTGGINSPLFFLIYLLLFFIALLEKPYISFTIALTLILSYLTLYYKTLNFETLVLIFSLILITPFALYLGNEYLENKKIKDLKIQKEKDFFLFLSLKIKPNIKKILKAIDENPSQKNLKKAKKALKNLLKLIDKYENEI